MPRWALLLALAVAIVVAAWRFAPYLTTEREVVEGTPSPPPFGSTTLTPLRPGQRACLDAVALDRRSEQVSFTVGTKGKPGEPLVLELMGDGYREEVRIGRYRDSEPLRVPIDPPGQSVLARACIANRGERAVELYGTTEGRSLSRPVVSVDGRETAADVTFVLYRAEPESVLSRLDEVLERMTAFRPGLFGIWVPWALLFLVVVVMPAAAFYALRSAFMD